MQANSWHKLLYFICPFESRECEKKGKKLRRFEYLDNEKSFLDEIRIPIIWWKNKKQCTGAFSFFLIYVPFDSQLPSAICQKAQ